MARTIISASAVALAISVGSPTLAAVIYPGPFVGSDITYTDVTEASAFPLDDPEPLFGAPTVSGNTLDFNPSAGAFASSAPPPDVTDGALRFVVSSNSELDLASLLFTERGDFAFTGVTPGGEFVSAQLQVTVLDENEDVLVDDDVSFFELFDAPTNEIGPWALSLNIDIPDGHDTVIVELDNVLTASSTTGNTASIRKKDFDVTFNVIPEPATAGIFGLAAFGLLTRRRRN